MTASTTPHVAVISGTIDLFPQGTITAVRTPRGEVPIIPTEEAFFLPRHGCSPQQYVLPHQIDHTAHFLALKSLPVDRVFAVNSTGSLKLALPPGTLVVPHDFIFWGPNPTLMDGKCRHVTPILDEGLRSLLIMAARDCGATVAETGVYWQTWGPRFETRAEITLMSQWVDIVGMTMASECICATEAGIRYAAICSVDNYANGITPTPLAMEEVSAGARRNEALLARIIRHLLTEYGD